MNGHGAIPVSLMPMTDTAAIDDGPADYLTESIHRHMIGGDMHRERVTCPLATTAELPIVEDGQ